MKVDNIWEGIYENFQEVQGDLDAFDTLIWSLKQKDKTRLAIDNYCQGNGFSKDYPLSVMVAMLKETNTNLRILDFGGGMGFHYFDLISKIPRSKNDITYFVVEGKATIKKLLPNVNDFSNLKFVTNLDDIHGNIDILHIGSSLQYIDDWKGLLLKVKENFNPKYFVFSDLLSGDIPTFVSHQNFYGKKIPCRFVNWNEFDCYLNSLDFNMLFKSKFIAKILNQDIIFPNENFPSSHQIDRTLNVIYSNSGKWR